MKKVQEKFWPEMTDFLTAPSAGVLLDGQGGPLEGLGASAEAKKPPLARIGSHAAIPAVKF